MRPLTLHEMVIAIGGRVYGEITMPRVTGVSTDTRTLAAGDMFFAIKGETHDGHAFINTAMDKGAASVVVSDLDKVDKPHLATGRIVQVPDVTAALGRLAGWYRRQFAAQVVAVVGSNGKTTTKDMIAAVLSSKLSGKWAKASFNNHIGVPVTLLSVEPADEFVVVEIGTNHPGEIAALARIAKPDMAVITSIGEEHLEFFGDVKSVAREEFSLLPSMAHRAFVALSTQAATYAPSPSLAKITALTYGLEEEAALRATQLVAEPDGTRFVVNDRSEYFVPVLGRHNVVNALGAVAIGMRFRMSHEEIAHGLRSVSLPPMRMQRSMIGDITLINDAYNANPSSMRAAIGVVDSLPTPGRRVLILGDMRELGEQSTRCHQALGQDAGRSTAQLIVAVGAHSRIVADGATATAGTTKRIYAMPTVEAAAEKIGGLLEPGDIVLLKASRGVKLERLVPYLGAAGAARSRPQAVAASARTS